MKNFNWAIFNIFIFPSICLAQAPSNSLNREIKWNKPIEAAIADDGSANDVIKVFSFEGAHYQSSKKFLPVFGETFPSFFDNNVVEVNATLVNDIYQPLEESSLISDASLISNSIIINTHIGYERKKPLISYAFIPIRKNPVTNAFEKLVSFSIQFLPAKTINVFSNNPTRYYAPTSVLASGTWYKIGVTQDGVYKITYEFLRQMGLDMTSLDPRNIKLFGNGGGMVPVYNAAPRPDDLTENAIEIMGESDGVFNNTDYILFYGQSPDRWYLNSADNRFHHTDHLFSDTTYYFISPDVAGSSKRISIQPSLSPMVTDIQVNTFDDYQFHEINRTNFVKSGRKFYGEAFDVNLSQNFSFSFPNLVTSSPVYFNTNVIAHSFSSSSFSIKYNSQQLCQINISPVGSSSTSDFANEGACATTFYSAGSPININYNYNQPASTSVGYLDFMELNAERSLSMSGNQMLFRNKNVVIAGGTASYNLFFFNSNINIWDVTDIYNIKEQAVSVSGNFILTSDVMREFIAFNKTDGLLTPQAHGKIDNQNLHASSQIDLIIISPTQFLSEANRLADFHRTHDGFRVVVADVKQIYNEFSSGMRDIAAIRDFAKMFYDRSLTDFPRYLCLFGDGSYENKRDFTNNTNYLPTYQSINSISVIDSYVSDDWFGFLDSLEGNWNFAEYVDLGIGRLPVKSIEEARVAVDKIIRYATTGSVTDPTACSSSNSSLGDWRNIICFIADDEDGNTHINQADTMLVGLDPSISRYNRDKIYLDSYQQETTPGGARYPAVNDAINNRVEKGALVINYIGHGGELGLAHENILNNAMINAWNNKFNMPLFITATCEFSRFDDPARTSAGEFTFLNPNGGGIGLFSTTRVAFAFQNGYLNKALNRHMFEKPNGEFPSLGDIFRLTKRESYIAPDPNAKNFTLLGDPALKLAYPKYDIVATKINGIDLIPLADTISALSRVTITGEIKSNGQKLTNFNGVVYPTIYDKAVSIKTLANDAQSYVRTFSFQKNILYKGKASVTNGDFSFTFIVPKDIAYNFGTGRLSFYAQNGVEDAAGYYDSLIIGGISQNVLTDNTGPDIKLYLNDEKFIFGGTTNEHPKIYALLSDSNGINTVGNGIGHDITASLDGKTDDVILLNDFYESDLNSYQKGKILYNLNDLSEGRHSMKLKVWDIYNNSSEAYTEFVVASSAEIALNHVLNYPNPFTTHTSFFFEHNQACNDLDVQVQIYTVSGKLVKTIADRILCEGYRSDKIEWDGKDDFGDPIGRGVYVYKLKVKNTEGKTAEKFEKLVVLR